MKDYDDPSKKGLSAAPAEPALRRDGDRGLSAPGLVAPAAKQRRKPANSAPKLKVLAVASGADARRADDADAEVGRLYREIEELSLAGGGEEVVASKVTELRRLQNAEAERRTEHAKSRSQLAPGEGYALLEKARRLLAK